MNAVQLTTTIELGVKIVALLVLAFALSQVRRSARVRAWGRTSPYSGFWQARHRHLHRRPTTAGLSGGIAHFGFRLVDPGDIDHAIAEVERAGGRLLRRGEFAPGLPYAYVADPDGYEIEIWFE